MESSSQPCDDISKAEDAPASEQQPQGNTNKGCCRLSRYDGNVSAQAYSLVRHVVTAVRGAHSKGIAESILTSSRVHLFGLISMG